MTEQIQTILIAIHITGVIITYGYAYAYTTRSRGVEQYDSLYENAITSLIVALLWFPFVPIAILTDIIRGRKWYYGFRWI